MTSGVNKDALHPKGTPPTDMGVRGGLGGQEPQPHEHIAAAERMCERSMGIWGEAPAGKTGRVVAPGAGQPSCPGGGTLGPCGLGIGFSQPWD